mmetsp:Transcript_22933/g.36488  ORF Transcript_22933/g.36488 Transcript_22933/m.36488 type:complete len:129 (-) Transcript_22933:359-745(-)
MHGTYHSPSRPGLGPRASPATVVQTLRWHDDFSRVQVNAPDTIFSGSTISGQEGFVFFYWKSPLLVPAGKYCHSWHPSCFGPPLCRAYLCVIYDHMQPPKLVYIALLPTQMYDGPYFYHHPFALLPIQ